MAVAKGVSKAGGPVTAATAAKAPGVQLHATVFASGAAVMAVEIVGTRTLAPVFGAGLFVWAALLSVTLCALALGYYWGGALIDRNPVPRSLGLVLACGAAVLALAVVCAPPLLLWGLDLGPRAGALLTALLLFGPCLTALGMVSPIAVRLATTQVERTGHRVGATYAVSTAGSLFGTLLIVFVLIPAVETTTLLLGTSGLLALIGALWLGKSVGAVATLPPIAAMLLVHSSVRALPPDLRILERVQSPFGLLEVFEDSTRGVRLLRADHSVIGGSLLDRDRGIFTYVHVLEALRFMRPQARDMLQIGLGTGALAMAMQRRGITTDVVEIDPDVERLARKHFYYVPPGRSTIADARLHLNVISRKYDLIVHDTFTGGVAPVHLLSLEVLQRLRDLLRPGGIAVVNFLGFSAGPHAESSHALANTMRAVFPHVRVFRDSPAEATPTLANMMFFGSDAAIDPRLPEQVTFESTTCEHALTRFAEWEVLQSSPPAPVVTDARNPLMRMQMPSAEEHFRAMQKLLPARAWLPW